MLDTVKTYKIKVNPLTNRLGRDIFGSTAGGRVIFYECVDGIVYACTDDIEKIYGKFGKPDPFLDNTVLGIEEVDYDKESGLNILYAIFD